MFNRNRPSVRTFGRARGTARGAALAVGLAASLVVAASAPVRADDGLTGAVAASYFPRTVDAGLHAIAHQRVAEISACPTCMNHSLMRAGTAEVLAFNFGSGDPIGGAVAQWRGSPTHNAILSNASLGRIGCAATTVAGTSFFVCVLAAGPLPAGAAPAPPSGGGGGGAGAPATRGGGVVAGALPDTAAEPASRGGSWRVLA